MNAVTLMHEGTLHGGARLSFVLLLATCASAAVSLLAQVVVVDTHRLLFVLRSHNTKTTTWLDPRLAKKAKPPEKCEDGGTALRSWSTQACRYSINYSSIYIRAYLYCICPHYMIHHCT